MTNKLEKSFKKFNSSVKKEENWIPGRLGISTGIVSVPNRHPFVYVRLRNNQSELIQAYNDTVQPTFDLPVIVVREGNRYIISGRDGEVYSDWENDNPYMSAHGDTHRMNPMVDGGGSDVLWVEGSQFLPSLVYPFGQSNSMSVLMYSYTLKDREGNWKVIGATGTPDLTPYKPRSGSSVVLVSIDTVSGNPYILATTGTYISEGITGTSQLVPYLPSNNDGRYLPNAFIRLESGTSTIDWNNIYDLRQLLTVNPTGTSGGGTIYAQNEGGVPSPISTFNFVGDNVDVSVSGTVARVFVTGSAGGVSAHNDLSGIQGGGTGSYFHLNGVQVNGLVSGSYTALHQHSGTLSDGNKGDVTIYSGTASIIINNDAVTFAKLQNITDARLLGRSAGSSGDAQEIVVGSGLSLSGGSLTATGGSAGDKYPMEFRLTLESGVPVSITDQIAKTTIYCTPMVGNQIALYDGASTWTTYTSAEFSLALGTLTASLPYDVFCYNNSGTPTLEFLAWTNATTRATALAYQNGILVKSGATTRRYLGTFYTSSTTTTEFSEAKRYLWNYYNRVTVSMYRPDTTDSWTYSDGVNFRQANGSSSNQLDFVIGVQEDAVIAWVQGNVSNSTSTYRQCRSSIGFDSTTPEAKASNAVEANNSIIFGAPTPIYVKTAGVGRHYLTWLEQGGGANTQTWYGDNGATNIQSNISGIFRC